MKKIFAISLALLLMLVLFAGCGAEAAKDEAYMEAPNYTYGESMREDSIVTNGSTADMSTGNAVTTNRKLIRRVSLQVETENYDELFTNVQQMVTQAGGYIESMDANTRYGSTSRYANLTIRVPADRLDIFTQDVAAVSNVVYRSESTSDVTLTYVDMESRKAALLIEQERLLALLEQSGSLTEILEIESRLTEVRYELESIESQLRTYDNLIDYATVSLSISEVQVLTPTAEKGFWEKIGDGFLNSISGLWNILKEVFSFLVIAFPYLLVFVILPLIVVLFIIRRKRK